MGKVKSDSIRYFCYVGLFCIGGNVPTIVVSCFSSQQGVLLINIPFLLICGRGSH